MGPRHGHCGGEGEWDAQYQQRPTGEENAIIKREWWNKWEKESVPQLEYVIQSYDTAFSKRETADYSAITTWGVFYPNEGGSGPNLILLDSKKGRWDFPELKGIALEEYEFWDPDTVIVEAKASGMRSISSGLLEKRMLLSSGSGGTSGRRRVFRSWSM